MKINLSILKEITSTCTLTSHLDSASSIILDLTLNYFKATKGSNLSDTNGNLTFKAARGIKPEIMSNLSIKKGQNICGRVAHDRVPLLVSDIITDNRIDKEFIDNYETGSFICCPFMMKEKLLGIINLADKINGQPFSEEEFELIQILSDHIAISLEYVHLKSTLYATTIELNEKNKAINHYKKLEREFETRISHELRKPLHSIKGALYYIRGKNKSESNQDEFVSILSDESTRLINILDKMSSFTNF